MKTRIRAAIMLSTFAVVLTFALASFAQLTGGYKPIEKTHAGANLAAQFAVGEQSKKSKMTFKLDEVVKAEIWEGTGKKIGSANFRDCLKVNDGKRSSFVQAVVSMDQYNNFALVSWAASKCGEWGEYAPVEKTHAGADLAAKYAVGEESKILKTPVKLVGIVKAEIQDGMGRKMGAANFRLCLIASGKGVGPGSQAIVSMDQYSNFKLVSWTDSKCSETDGEFEQVENSHAGIGLAADFAVKKHSADTKIKHTLAGILKGEIKGMFSPVYRVCMKVSEKGKTQVIQAVVSMDQYSNMKLVSWEHSTCGK